MDLVADMKNSTVEQDIADMNAQIEWFAEGTGNSPTHERMKYKIVNGGTG